MAKGTLVVLGQRFRQGKATYK